MTKPIEIIQAWKNYVKPTDDIKEIAAERMAICNGCVAKDHSKLLNYDYCSVCSCPLVAKTHSPINSCDLDKWIR